MPPRTLREQLKKSPASPSLAALQARFLFEAARAVSGTVPSVSSHLGRSSLSLAQIEARALPRGAAQSICSNCGSPALHDTPARCAPVSACSNQVPGCIHALLTTFTCTQRRAQKLHRAGRRRPAERCMNRACNINSVLSSRATKTEKGLYMSQDIFTAM